MSYILDALRRAEAERERGRVPGIGAQPAPASTAASPARRRRTGLLAGAAVLVAVVVAAAWWAWPHASGPDGAPSRPAATAPREAERPADPEAAAPVVTTASPAAAPAPATLPIVVSAPPAPAPEAVPPVAPSAPSVATPATAPAAAPVAAARTPTPTPSTPPRSAATSGLPATTAGPGASARSAEPAVLPLAALGAEQRRDWPAWSIGGAVYSDSPASRFVVVGGQIVREGEEAAPGVVVERIGPRSAVVRWRGLRVEVPFG